MFSKKGLFVKAQNFASVEASKYATFRGFYEINPSCFAEWHQERIRQKKGINQDKLQNNIYPYPLVIIWVFKPENDHSSLYVYILSLSKRGRYPLKV